MINYIVHTSATIKTIELKYLESGHTDMEVDSMHSVIERATKKKSVYSPIEWNTILRNARRSKPYHVIEMFHTDFIDTKALFKSLNSPMRKDTEGNPANFLKIKKILFDSREHKIFFKTSYREDEDYKTFGVTGRKAAVKPIDISLTKVYNQPLPLSIQKQKDLNDLCVGLLIPREYHQFYNSLISSTNARDKLSEPDDQESDQEEDE